MYFLFLFLLFYSYHAGSLQGPQNNQHVPASARVYSILLLHTPLCSVMNYSQLVDLYPERLLWPLGQKQHSQAPHSALISSGTHHYGTFRAVSCCSACYPTVSTAHIHKDHEHGSQRPICWVKWKATQKAEQDKRAEHVYVCALTWRVYAHMSICWIHNDHFLNSTRILWEG